MDFTSKGLRIHYKGITLDSMDYGTVSDIKSILSKLPKKDKQLVCIYSKSYICSYVLPVILYGTNINKVSYNEKQRLQINKSKLRYVDKNILYSILNYFNMRLDTVGDYYKLYSKMDDRFIKLCELIINRALKGFIYNNDGILIKLFY